MDKWRILVVDDDSDIRDLVRTSLEPQYEVVEARDGLDALEKLERAEPDFMILDVMMPLMDGIQTCEAVRRHPRFRDMKVLFLSALTSKDDIQRGYGAGANLYLTKPFDPPRLKRNVDLFFEKRAETPPHHQRTLSQLAQLEQEGPEALARATVESPRASPTAAAPSGIKPRILVVDDEPGICSLAMGALQPEFEVFCAGDGLDAIGKITTYQPDILLIDTMMPRMSGYQLCQSLRKNHRFAHTPIILASAKHSQKDREYSLRIGGNYFMQKPYTSIEVLHAAREMVRHPDFRMHPKALSEDSIRELESLQNRGKMEKDKQQEHHQDIHNLERFVRDLDRD